MSATDMNTPHPEDPDIMLEYDFSGPDVVRGKYAKAFPEGSIARAVVLEPDVAKVFKNSE